MEKLKLLIIDDDENLCESLRDTIELEGYSVDLSHTAEDGLKRVESEFYNVILLDQKLPNSHGLVVLSKIKKISPDTEVIIFTAYAETESVIKAMDKNAFAFLPKPFETPVLITTLKGACEKQTVLLDNKKLLSHLKTLNIISQIVAESLDIKKTILKVLEEVFAITGFHIGIVCEYPDDKHNTIVSTGLSQKFLQEVAGKAREDTLCGYTFGSNERIYIEKNLSEYVIKEGLPNETVAEVSAQIITREGLESYFGFPIRHKQEAVAVLSLFDKRPRKLSPDTLELMTSICNQLGSSIVNQRLFQKVCDSKKDWETTFDSISDLISIHDEDSNIIKCNNALVHKLNVKHKDILGKKCYKVFHGCDEPLPGCAILRCIETIKPTEEEIACMGGIFLMSCFPRFDKFGKFDGIVHIARDITESKQIEEALKVSEEKFRAISETANDCIIMVTNDGKVSYWNKAAVKTFYYTSEEAVGQYLHELVIPTNQLDRFRKGFTRFRDTGQVQLVGKTVELTAKRKDGTEFPIEHSISAVQLKGKWNAIGIIRDITERKNNEEVIRQNVEKLKMISTGIIDTLALTIEQRDPYTAGHQQRVSLLACAIAGEMGLTAYQTEGIRMAGNVHDIGKMHIPSEILSRPGKLTKDEYSIVRSHVQVGYDILKGIEFPWPVADIMHQHHENMDGSGYPLGLRDGAILLEARILCVADVVEAMASHRPYRPALGMDKSLEKISRGKGTLYDANVVFACLKIIKEGKFEFEE